MPAAQPGTIALSCTTGGGAVTATICFDAGTGAFNTAAVVVAGSSPGRLTFCLADGDRIDVVATPGNTVDRDDLAAHGITNWAQVHTVLLAAEALT